MKPPGSLRPPRTLRSRALQLLAQRDQSRAELRRKLLAHARAEQRAQAAGGTGQTLAAPPEFHGDRAPAAARGHPSGSASGGTDGEHTDFDQRSDRFAALQSQVEDVLAWLDAQGFVSDERFAESRIHARSARFGNRRIRQELAQHDLALTPEAQQALVATEQGRAEAVRSRKFSAVPGTAAEVARQGRFLLARGFSPDVIRRVLRQATQGPDESG